MKKIIYSLVIMIAAGSLFTSCIEQVEPEGIRNMRDAKADYIRSLKDVNAANAELKRAEAAVKEADAAYKAAETAWMSEKNKLENEKKALENELLKAENEKKAADFAKQIAELEQQMKDAQHKAELDEIEHQKNVAKAQDELREALRDLELKAQDLTSAEKKALISAAAAYYVTVEAVSKQNLKVVEAQKKLASLENTTENNEDMVSNYKSQIAAKQKQIDALKEKLAGVADMDYTKWNEEIKEYAAQIEALKAEQYKIEIEFATYYAKTIHDGVEDYNMAIKEWWNKNNPGTSVLNYISTGSALSNIKFTDLKIAEEEVNNPAYVKFRYLLSDYNPTYIETEDEELVKIKATSAMRDFILGTDTDKENVLKNGNTTVATAKYGLVGALSVLKRDKVLNPEQKPDVDKAKATMEAAKKLWSEHRDTLINGMFKYEPFADSLKQYQDFITKNAGAANGMVSAIEALAEAFDSMQSNNSDFSAVEANALFAAIVDFAKARENYLVYNYEEEMDDEEYDHGAMNRFYYKTTSTGSKKNILFSAMKQTDLYKGAYQYEVKATEIAEMDKDQIFERVVLPTLGNIVAQFFSGNEEGEGAVYTMEDKTTFTIADINDNPGVFYGFYEYYDGEEADEHDGSAHMHYAVKIGDHEAGEEYDPNFKEIQPVLNAVADYMTIYNKYWAVAEEDDQTEKIQELVEEYLGALNTQAVVKANEESTADQIKKADDAVAAALKAINAKLDELYKASCYSYETFTDPYRVVNFAKDGVNPDYSEAMGAILGSVDPAKTVTNGTNFNIDGVVKESVIFGDPENELTTEFYDLMMAEYLYDVAVKSQDIATAIEVIEKWVETIKAEFEAGVTKDETNAEDLDAKAKAYKEKLFDFIGSYTSSGKVYPNRDNYNPTVNFLIGGTYDSENYKDFKNSELYKYIEMGNLTGTPTGNWSATAAGRIGGQLLKENLDKYFPELPAKMKAWVEKINEVNDEIAHLEILKAAAENAYVEMAKLAEGKSYKTLDEVIADVKKKINDQITTLTNEKKALESALAKVESGQSAVDVEIARAKTNLETAQNRLAVLEQARDLAKANYEKVADYIKAQDFGFVNIFETLGEYFDIDDIIEALKDKMIGYLS